MQNLEMEKRKNLVTMVPCYGFRLLCTIVLTKGSLKLLSKNWFIAYLSVNGGINCFVVLIILNALKKLT